MITSARIKAPFQTKHVHLYPGDEVDILSKSDDGSHMEFEVLNEFHDKFSKAMHVWTFIFQS